MKTAAIILARAGSRGVPSKNIRPVGGRPCVEWTIEFALRSHRVSRVILSTDCPTAARIGARHGVDIVDRPAELASDTATVDGAARHALEAIRDPSIEAVAILYGNVPVRPAGLADEAIALLASRRGHSVQSYTAVGKNHPYWMAVVDPATGGIRPWDGEVLNHGVYRRQDLPPAFVPDGGMLAVRRDALMLKVPTVDHGPHAFLGTLRHGIITQPGAVVDIDSEIDVLVADAILRSQAMAVSAA